MAQIPGESFTSLLTTAQITRVLNAVHFGSIEALCAFIEEPVTSTNEAAFRRTLANQGGVDVAQSDNIKQSTPLQQSAPTTGSAGVPSGQILVQKRVICPLRVTCPGRGQGWFLYSRYYWSGREGSS